ncbi:glycosyltransferase [Sphingobacterium sp.]|uniref:glycosyltransferase n=1 Tax=Sphingobacterium sp. TaxID=341027 RepID=UPI0028A1F369|nr:glycosyltransferase [Sphingobacterium sp.]
MNIAFISPYPPSQVTLNEYGYHLIRSFIQKYPVERIYVLSDHLGNNLDYQRYKIEGIEIIPCWKFNSLLSFWHIYKTLKTLKVDAIIFNMQFMTFGDRKIPAALGLLTPWLCRKLGIPSIVLLHNITETVKLDTIGMAKAKWKENILLKIGEMLTKIILKADLVGVTISQYVDILRKKYHAEHVVLLPHGNFELPERTYINEPPNVINLMAFGKFGTYKKVEVLIEATLLLRAKYPEYKFIATIAGNDNPNVKGYLKSVEQRYNGIEDLVFTGYIAEEDVAKIFQDSTFVIFPYTTTTGSSGILHQAGSYARACILPKIDDLERVVEEEGYSGAFFETDNPVSMAEAVTYLLQNPEERRKIEDQNYAAAKGLPMNELAEWYISHLNVLIKAKRN